MRLIGAEEEQVGVVDTHEAMRMAREAGMDLVEVAPTARPPVCRIMDYGKFKYAQKKKDHRAKAHRHEVVLKEVRMRPKTDVHDQGIKTTRAREFLDKGNKVQFTMLFRGREMAHLDIGRESFSRIKTELADVAKVERDYKIEGRRMTMVLAPMAAEPEKKAPKPPKAPKPAPEKPASQGEATQSPAAEKPAATTPPAGETPQQS